jgi:hypothetical protein
MERLGIVGERRDQQIVGLGDGAVRLVPDPVAQGPLLVIAAGHRQPSFVIPAKAGIHTALGSDTGSAWIPAFAGMT